MTVVSGVEVRGQMKEGCLFTVIETVGKLTYRQNTMACKVVTELVKTYCLCQLRQEVTFENGTVESLKSRLEFLRGGSYERGQVLGPRQHREPTNKRLVSTILKRWMLFWNYSYTAVTKVSWGKETRSGALRVWTRRFSLCSPFCHSYFRFITTVPGRG